MRRLRILIHLAGGAHWIGGVQYTRNLLRALSRLPASACPPVILHVGGKNAGGGYEAEFGRLANVTIDRPKPMVWTLRNWIRRTKPNPGRLSDDCTVAFPVKDGAASASRANLYWVPDFQYKHLPHFFPDTERRKRDLVYDEMFGQARYLVASSEAVKADFERFFPKHRHVQVRILRFCSVFSAEELQGNPAAVRARYGLPERFAYVPNQFWQHKGHDTVFNALARLRSGGLKVPVVTTGSTDDYRTNEHMLRLRQVIEANNLGDQLTMLGLIPREDQIQVLRQAALVVHASRFEGWSTVVEDVRGVGKPIVLSDLAVHKEQDPPHADFFPVGDAERLADVLARRWPACEPGPSPREPEIFHEAEARTVAFARTFLAIATEAYHAWAMPHQKAG